MSDVSERLVQLLERGELVPIGHIKVLKAFAPATVCRFALTGKIPALKIGRRFLTCESIVREALASFVTKPQSGPQKQSSGPSDQSVAAEGAKNRLRARGLRI